MSAVADVVVADMIAGRAVAVAETATNVVVAVATVATVATRIEEETETEIGIPTVTEVEKTTARGAAVADDPSEAMMAAVGRPARPRTGRR